MIPLHVLQCRSGEYGASPISSHGIARSRLCRYALRLFFVLVIGLTQQALRAQSLVVRAPPQTRFTQRLNAQLPLSATFTDDSGRPRRLGVFFDDRPVVLVLSYYHCPNLCSTLMDGVLQTLAAVGLPAHAYHVLGVSIDPSENPQIAARKKATYASLLANTGGDLTLLTGAKPEIDALANRIGFEYAYDRQLQQYIHPAGFIVATRDGRISHYFMGVRFDPRDVRLALVDASSGNIGSAVDQLLLLCSHFDPTTGRYTTQVLAWIRALSLTLLAALVIWMWRTKRRRTT